MKKLNCVLLVLASILVSSQGLQGQQELDKKDFSSFGEAIEMDNSMELDVMMSKLLLMDSVHATIIATVNEVCQKKGCWMKLSSEKVTETLFVKFKDYGFFVPKDISGKEVILEGVAYKEVTSVEELQHYAEDAGKPQSEIDDITDPKEEFRFMAKGVLVKN